LIGRPPLPEYIITNTDIFDILVWVEKQGGDKSMAWKINKKFEEIVRRSDSDL